MEMVIRILKKEKREALENIVHCKAILKIEGQEITIYNSYKRMLKSTENLLNQLEKAIEILKK